MSSGYFDDCSSENASQFQVVYLDFDGAETVYQNYDLGIEYQLNIVDSLISEERQIAIVDALNEQYKEPTICLKIMIFLGCLKRLMRAI